MGSATQKFQQISRAQEICLGIVSSAWEAFGATLVETEPGTQVFVGCSIMKIECKL